MVGNRRGIEGVRNDEELPSSLKWIFGTGFNFHKSLLHFAPLLIYLGPKWRQQTTESRDGNRSFLLTKYIHLFLKSSSFGNENARPFYTS